MASKKKKFEGTEVVVTAPRMGRVERYQYDVDKRYSDKTGTPMNKVPSIRRKENEEMQDMAMGFSGPMTVSKIGAIDLRKMSKLGRWGQDLASRIVGSGGDNVIASASAKEKQEKVPDDWEYDPKAASAFAKGGHVKSRGNGIAKRGLTKGRMR